MLKYYTYEELRPIALKDMRDEFFSKLKYQFLGDKEKLFDSKLEIGKWIDRNGYVKTRKQINGIRKVYYAKHAE